MAIAIGRELCFGCTRRAPIMTSTDAIAALADTGKAILVSQTLEKLLVELLEFRKLHQSFDYAH